MPAALKKTRRTSTTSHSRKAAADTELVPAFSWATLPADVEYVRIAHQGLAAVLRPWAQNPRRITDEAVAGVVNSLKAFDWGRPLIVNRRAGHEGELVAGHTTFKAVAVLQQQAAQGDADALRALERGIPVRLVDLPAAKARALAIADNKTAERSTWEWGMLATVYQGGELAAADWSSAGFLTEELTRLGGFESGAFLDAAAGGGGDVTGNTNDPAPKGFANLTFTLTLAEKSLVLEALSRVPPAGKQSTSKALVAICRRLLKNPKG